MECSFEGCGKQVWSNGLCNGHNQQKWLGKELLPLRVKRTVLKDKNGRVCTTCDEYKPNSEFYLHSETGKPRARCKVCAVEYQKSYHNAAR